MVKSISELVKFLRPLEEIVIIAPDSPHSGSGSALTVTHPAHYQLVKKEVGLIMYKCIGTPTDCIKLALGSVLNRRPDLIVGGINHGGNSAISVHYLGAMGVAIGGCLKGIPSIGFSLRNYRPDADFEPSGSYTRKIAATILEKGLPPLTCLNVSFPDTPNLKGVKVCEQVKGCRVNGWVTRPCLDDHSYSWLISSFIGHESENEDNDHQTLEDEYVATTPTTIDMTAYGLMGELNGYCQQLEF